MTDPYKSQLSTLVIITFKYLNFLDFDKSENVVEHVEKAMKMLKPSQVESLDLGLGIHL